SISMLYQPASGTSTVHSTQPRSPVRSDSPGRPYASTRTSASMSALLAVKAAAGMAISTSGVGAPACWAKYWLYEIRSTQIELEADEEAAGSPAGAPAASCAKTAGAPSSTPARASAAHTAHL